MKRLMGLAMLASVAVACGPVLSGVGTVTGQRVTYTATATEVSLANDNGLTLERPRAYLRGAEGFKPDPSLCQPFDLGFFCTLAPVLAGKVATITYTGKLESGTLRYVTAGQSHVLALNTTALP